MKILFKEFNAGFFANFNKIITHIWIMQKRYSDTTSFCYYVDFGESGCFLYGGNNMWSELFTTLIPDINNTYDMVITDWFHNEELLFIAERTHTLLIDPTNKTWRYELNNVYNNYISHTPELQKEINIVDDLFNKYFMIGVHIRSSAHYVEQHNKTMPSIEMYITNIKNYISTLDSMCEYRIFLATDTIEAVDIFKNEFSDKLISLDQDRYNNGEQEWVIPSTINKAKDVYKDAVFLSKTKVLFHVISNVSFAALYMNPELESKYIYT